MNNNNSFLEHPGSKIMEDIGRFLIMHQETTFWHTSSLLLLSMIWIRKMYQLSGRKKSKENILMRFHDDPFKVDRIRDNGLALGDKKVVSLS